jgi:hypothetical protein
LILFDRLSMAFRCTLTFRCHLDTLSSFDAVSMSFQVSMLDQGLLTVSPAPSIQGRSDIQGGPEIVPHTLSRGASAGLYPSLCGHVVRILCWHQRGVCSARVDEVGLGHQPCLTARRCSSDNPPSCFDAISILFTNFDAVSMSSQVSMLDEKLLTASPTSFYPRRV